MPRFKVALILAAALTAGCASQNQVESLQAAHADVMALLAQQAEMLQLQGIYLRNLEDEYLVLAEQLEESERARSELVVQAAPDQDQAPAPQPTEQQSGAVTAVDGKLLLGRTEWVWIDLFKRDLQVDVDAGRQFSIMNVTDSQPFERDGRDWVSFTVELPAEDASAAETLQLEAPLLRRVRLRTGSDGRLESRPVVRLTTKIGPLVEDVQFVLVHNAGVHPVASLGRAFLRDIALVDSSRKFIQPSTSPR